MKDTITQSQFTDRMRQHGFTYEGANALFDYLQEYEESTDQELEFDPIAFRCEFFEYETIEEALNEYEFQSLSILERQTQVIFLDNGGIIVQAF